jgi:hypothetical protein
MACTFKWYNLPTKIKEETGLIVKWRSLPTKLNTIYKALAVQKPTCAATITYEEFKWFGMSHKIGIICDLLGCTEPLPLYPKSATRSIQGSIVFPCLNMPSIDIPFYFDGIESYPTVGDYVFEDLGREVSLPDGVYYSLANEDFYTFTTIYGIVTFSDIPCVK